MIDAEHPIIKDLVRRGYQLELHAYLRDGSVKTTITARNKETGDRLQGWSKTGDQAGAIADLARRAGLDTSAESTSKDA